MKCKRLNEVIELLQPAWQKEPDLNLLQFLQKLAKESGFDGELADLTDDILIYHPVSYTHLTLPTTPYV